MKKSLVLAMAMALGVTASAYAANPFSDVPAGHWAYDSVAKLAAAGVVDGYADGAFDGDKLMTRYEMAQIVAKAMAKGADCDKLAAEFADELDTLGVRVAKLEKGADAVKIAGQIRYSYRDVSGSENADKTNRLRTRLILKGAINDDWTYTGRFEQNQYFDDNDDEDDITLNWAYVSGKIGGVKVDMGRQDFKIHNGTVIDTRFDGVKAAYGKDVKVTAYVGKNGKDLKEGKYKVEGEGEDATVTDEWIGRYGVDSEDRFYAVDVASKLGVVDAYATFYKYDAEHYANKIWAVGAAMPLAKGLTLKAEYLHGDVDEAEDCDSNGWMAGVAYKGAKASVPGSWGAYVNYYDQPVQTYFYNSIESFTILPSLAEGDGDGFKGYEIGANYALAKNIVAAVKYYDFEAREGNDTEETIWTEVTFTF